MPAESTSRSALATPRPGVDATRPGAAAGVRAGRRAGFCVVFLLLSAFLVLPNLRALDEFPEYQLKAAFLYNFAKFTSWPAEAFSSPKAPLTIGVLGTDPFGAVLKNTVQGKTVNNRPILLRYLDRDESPKGCHILFISRSEAERIPAILASLAGQSSLTVSEVDRFA